MTAPYEKAKMAGYDVEPDGFAGGWLARDPEGEEIPENEEPGGGNWPTEAAAWEACDNHRMFGHVLGAHGELKAAGYSIRFARPDYGAWWRHAPSGERSIDFPTEAEAWNDAANHYARQSAADLREKLAAVGYDVRQEELGPRWWAIAPDGDGFHACATQGEAWEACERHRREAATFKPPQAVKLETRRVVVLPTGNLTLATCQMLESTPVERWPVAGGPIPHGFYVYAHDEGGCEEAPHDLRACCYWANRQGFDYIQFDCDADTFAPGLPVYDHDARPPVDALGAFAKVRDLFATWEGWATYSDSYSPADLLEAIAEAVGAPLNGKPAAPVAEGLAEKIARYSEALNENGDAPNGDDFNALLDFAEGQPYRPPHTEGR